MTRIAKVNTGVAGGGGDSGLTSYTLPATPAAGNIMLLVLVSRGGTTVSYPSGWTSLIYDDSGAGDARSMRVAAKVAVGSETSLSFDNTNGNAPEELLYYELSGFGGVLPVVDASGWTWTVDTATGPRPTITTTAHQPMLVLIGQGKTRAAPNPGPQTCSGFSTSLDTGYVTFGNAHRLTTWEVITDDSAASYGGGNLGTSSDGNDDPHIFALALKVNFPVTLVQHTSSENSAGNPTSLAATFGATPTAGNLLICLVTASKNAWQDMWTITGWQHRAPFVDGGGPVLGMFTKVAGQSESATVTVSGATVQRIAMSIYEFSGGEHQLFAELRETSDGAGKNLPSVTPDPGIDCVLLAVADAQNAYGITAYPSGYTTQEEVVTNDGTSIRLWSGTSQVWSPSGSYGGESITYGNSVQHASLIIVIGVPRSTPKLYMLQTKNIGTNSVDVTSLTLALDSVPVPGNLLVMWWSIGDQGLPAPTVPAGWTNQLSNKQSTGATDKIRVDVFTKVAGTSEPTSITVSHATSRHCGFVVQEFAAVQSGWRPAFQQLVSVGGAGGGTVTLPDITPIGSFPTVVTSATGYLSDTNAHMVVTMPSCLAGDTLVVIAGHRSGWANKITPTGWVDSGISDTTEGHIRFLTKTAVGDEGGTQVNFGGWNGINVMHAVWRVVVLRGAAAGVLAKTSIVEDASSSGSLSPSWGVADTLWLTSANDSHGRGGTSLTGYPSGFDVSQNTISTGGFSEISVSTAFKQDRVATLDPGAFTSNNGTTFDALVTWAFQPATSGREVLLVSAILHRNAHYMAVWPPEYEGHADTTLLPAGYATGYNQQGGASTLMAMSTRCVRSISGGTYSSHYAPASGTNNHVLVEIELAPELTRQISSLRAQIIG